MPSSNPASVDISKGSGVTITWSDGHRSQYGLEYLRDRCPCAMCGRKAEQGATPPGLPSLPLYKPRLRIVDVETVGRYALRFFWNDGHSTGIYSYDHLRSICPCGECQPQQARSMTQ
mgnify:CR=1 FL=1